MATEKAYLTYGDTLPVITATLGGVDCDLTGSPTVRFLLRASDGTEPLVDDTDHTSVVSTVEPKKVRFTPWSGMWDDDTAVPSEDGIVSYRCQFEITQADGEVITYPNKGYFVIVVQPGLDDVDS
jgi:hypothetical protein